MSSGDSGGRSAALSGAKLTAVMVAAWVVSVCIAYGISGANGVLGATVAAVLCLTPGWLVFAFQSLYGTAAPLGVVIAGSAIRMAVALVGALAVKAARPDLGIASFGVWLGVFYVVALATETKLSMPPPRRGSSSEVRP